MDLKRLAIAALLVLGLNATPSFAGRIDIGSVFVVKKDIEFAGGWRAAAEQLPDSVVVAFIMDPRVPRGNKPRVLRAGTELRFVGYGESSTIILETPGGSRFYTFMRSGVELNSVSPEGFTWSRKKEDKKERAASLKQLSPLLDTKTVVPMSYEEIR